MKSASDEKYVYDLLAPERIDGDSSKDDAAEAAKEAYKKAYDIARKNFEDLEHQHKKSKEQQNENEPREELREVLRSSKTLFKNLKRYYFN